MTAAGVRVLVVDDHPVVRSGVTLLTRRDPGLTVVGEAATAAEGVRAARRLRPHVVLLDLRLPDLPAVETVRRLRRAVPDARIVLFTMHVEPDQLEAVVAEGVHGCVLKDAGGDGLVDALRRVAAGGQAFDPRCRPGAAPRRAPAGPPLTRREHEVLRHVATGRTNPEIAAALNLSRNTVKTYLQTALQKLGARNRVEAIVRASELGLL